MDLVLSEQQQQLVDTAASFLVRYCPPSVVRQIEASPSGHDPEFWQRMAGLGWAGLVVPEAQGGSGQGMLELALLACQLGRAACTSPLLCSATLVAVPLAQDPAGTPAQRWLEGLADGSVIGTGALLDPQARNEWSALDGPASLEGGREGAGWRIRGAKTLVPFVEQADVLLMPAVLEGVGPALLAVEAQGVLKGIRRLAALGAEPLWAIELDGLVTEGEVVATGDRAVASSRRALDCAAVAATAYAAGLAAGALDLSVEHANGRSQFGQPIGSFQAVAHRCAEMRAELDAIELLAFQAAWALDHDPAPELAVAAAKGYANDAIRRVFLHAHQVHGAMGFTMEHDLQLFTRRAKAFELTWGSTDLHRERVAAAMGL